MKTPPPPPPPKVAEDLPAPGAPISVHQCIVTLRDAPEEWGDGCEVHNGWRGGLDPSCVKEEEEC